MTPTLRQCVLTAAVLIGGTTASWAGKIVVANDEWQTTNAGFANTPAGSTQFVKNVASFFAGGPGSFLVHSDNFSLDLDQATSFASALTTAGHSVVDSENIGGFTFNVATLLGYGGVFLALPPTVADQNVLVNYVNAGGNVYLNAGTGFGGPAVEAAAWNTFLNAFGLGYAPVYNGISGIVPIVSSHQVLAGVPSLYQDNGNSISLVGANPFAQIIATHAPTGAGLYAVYNNTTAVPEPASLLLLGLGVAGLALRRRT